ncbi:MAG: hypothetical protein IKX00_03345 [Bacilli bacterium]|nr:hypothetical protein [Bacilli bacterium]
MKLIEKDEKIILVNDDGNIVSPNEPIAINYIIDRYNSCLKGIKKIENELKMVGFTSLDQLNNATDPDADIINYYNSLYKGRRNKKAKYYNPTLDMIKDNYMYFQKEKDLIRKYISENNIDYGTVDENGFIVKKDQKR